MPESVSALTIALTHHVAKGRMQVEILASESGIITCAVSAECNPFFEHDDLIRYVQGVLKTWLQPELFLDTEALHDAIP